MISTSNSNDQIMDIIEPPEPLPVPSDPPQQDLEPPSIDAFLHSIEQYFSTAAISRRWNLADSYRIFTRVNHENVNRNWNGTDEQYARLLSRVINQDIESLRADMDSFADLDNRDRGVLYRQMLKKIDRLDCLMTIREMYLFRAYLRRLNIDMEDILMNVDRESPSVGGGLSEEAIFEGLKIRRCDDDDDDKEGEEICIVCQDQLFEENGIIATLGCGHEYHVDCIKKWLQLKNVCPLCRVKALPLDDDDDEDDSDDDDDEDSSS